MRLALLGGLCAAALPALADEPAVPVSVGGQPFTAADIAEGAAIFERRCSQCHGLDGRNYKGPHLDGVVGRPAASVPDWDYSPAMRGWGGVWTVAALQDYLTRPAAFIPDVAMNFGGFRARTGDRDKVIAFLIAAGGEAAIPSSD